MDPVTIGLLGLGAYLLLRKRTGRFIYRRKNGTWRAYFSGTPPSNSHVLHDSDGYYVCWDRALRSEREARQIAKRWIKIYG